MHDTKTQVQIVSTEKCVSYAVTDEMLIIARNIESGLLCGSEKQLSLAVSKIIELHEQSKWISADVEPPKMYSESGLQVPNELIVLCKNGNEEAHEYYHDEHADTFFREDIIGWKRLRKAHGIGVNL